jgi:hypothetical protein
MTKHKHHPRGGDGPQRWRDESARDIPHDWTSKAKEVASTAVDAAQSAAAHGKQTAASLTSEVSEGAKGFMNQQLEAGAELTGHIAESVRSGADTLGEKSPLVAEMARRSADGIDKLSESMQGQTVEEIIGTGSDFVRRRPALVFSAAALCGFALCRLLKVGPSERPASTGARR